MREHRTMMACSMTEESGDQPVWNHMIIIKAVSSMFATDHKSMTQNNEV
jgi:hypothetical protein